MVRQLVQATDSCDETETDGAGCTDSCDESRDGADCTDSCDETETDGAQLCCTDGAQYCDETDGVMRQL